MSGSRVLGDFTFENEFESEINTKDSVANIMLLTRTLKSDLFHTPDELISKKL